MGEELNIERTLRYKQQLGKKIQPKDFILCLMLMVTGLSVSAWQFTCLFKNVNILTVITKAVLVGIVKKTKLG